MSKYDISKTLFVSDLDGTLLRSDGKLMPETVEAVGRLVSKGVKFTYATARSYHTAMQAAGKLLIELPVILHNGVFIRDMKSGEYLVKKLLPHPEFVRSVFEEHGLSPFVYSADGDRQMYTYLPDRIPLESAAYQATRVNDPRDNPITDESKLWQGDVFYTLCITNDERAGRIYEKLRADYNCLYGEDYYSRDKWLEVYSKEASKASAVLNLRDILGCEKVVVFGDGANDIAMFEAADEAYAVSGAVEELKERATAVIGSNDDNAVVRWIYENVFLGKLQFIASR